ncbi:MAG: SCP2 sterol-binding domain-containing protein [Gammaproteobacteria bacterium]|nr:SCP2 sterol-binding domain-containing protein [Gammaproteobacteria bacterium]NND38597.1 hypothetical protein [Pseudomonadales bacterium]MBT8150835.1 SCP2 sterol-binding domain-containing protein [Gammaproteobacteria bacterium]NNL11557.1 hypothetical protein [Pseudomonadales bacterium]NNM11755.1 hypothetical protein [Pseudomonadales bacterium]
MPDPTLSIAACAAFERALNFAIALDDVAAKRFVSHNGKVVKLYVDNPALTVFVQLGENCRVMQHYSGQADVSLGGALADWFDLARSSDKTASLVNGNLSIHGDSKILISLGELAGELDIDWEAQLAELIGDVPAHLAGRAMRNAVQFGAQAAGIAKIVLDRVIEQHSSVQPQDEPADFVGDGLRAISDGLDKISNRDDDNVAPNGGRK